MKPLPQQPLAEALERVRLHLPQIAEMPFTRRPVSRFGFQIGWRTAMTGPGVHASSLRVSAANPLREL